MSASRMATRDTSGRSRPSRRRLMPTSTSNSPSRRLRMISIRSMVWTSECMYRTRDAGVFQVFRQVLRHLLGQGGHQHPLVPGGPGPDLVHQVVDLPLHGPDLHPRVQQARGTDHLLHQLVCPLALIGPRRGGDETPPGRCGPRTPRTSGGRLS